MGAQTVVWWVDVSAAKTAVWTAAHLVACLAVYLAEKREFDSAAQAASQ